VSVKVPVAVNCCVAPSGRLTVEGVTAIDTNVAGVTVRTVLPDTLPTAAEIVAVPMPTVLARPFEAPLLTIATAPLVGPQVAVAVTSDVVVSEFVPRAVNCRGNPFAMLGLEGRTETETSTAEETVSVTEPDIEPKVAVISEDPKSTPVARPFEPAALLTEIMEVVAEDHITVVVRIAVVASVNVPVAISCWLSPFGIFVVGVI